MSSRLSVSASPSASSLVRGAAIGALAGVAGAFAMERCQIAFSRLSGDGADAAQRATGRADEWSARTQDQLSGTPPATVRAAEAILGPLDAEGRRAAGPLFHYAFGAGAGAVYGMLAEQHAEVTRGLGVPFGLAVWGAADEVGAPALGLSRAAAERPPRAHMYSLLAHIVYGATTESVRRALRAAFH